MSSNNKSYNQNNNSNNNSKAVKPPDFYQFHLKVNTDGSVENVSDAPACHHCRCAKIACDRKRPCRTCVRKDRPCFDYDPSLANNNKKDPRGSSGSGSKQKSKTTTTKKTAQSSLTGGDAIHMASISGSSTASSDVVGGTSVSSASSDVGHALNTSVPSTASQIPVENDHQSTVSFPTATELHAPQSRSLLSYSELFSMPTMGVTGSSVADSVAQQQLRPIISSFESGSTRLDDHYANEHANKRTRLNQGGYISQGVSSTFPATASSFSSSVSNHSGDSMNYTSVTDTVQSQQLELLKQEVALLQFQLKQEMAKSEKLRSEELKLRIGEEIDLYARWLIGGSVPRVKLTVDLWNPPVDPSKGIIICSSSWTLIGCNQTLRDMGSYSLSELQDNFDGSFLAARSVAPMWKPLVSLMMLSMVKNFKRQSYFGTKDGQSICVSVDISLHRSFFWAELTPTDHLDDQVILDDVVISRTYRIPVSEANAHSTSINPRKSFIRMLDALSAYSSRVAYQDDREKQETILRQISVLALGASPDTSSSESS